MGKNIDDHRPAGTGAYDSDSDDEFLLAFDAHIRSEARRAVPSELFSADVLDLETDELAQEMRIKLWASRQQRSITYPKPYIRTIARTVAVDLVRRHRPDVSLYGDTAEEVGPGDVLVAQNEGFRDPLYELELIEVDSEHLTKLAEAILNLPSRQKQAMLYALFESKDDTLPLLRLLKTRGIDVEAREWPDEEHEAHLLKASLAVARRKLHYLLAEFIAV